MCFDTFELIGEHDKDDFSTPRFYSCKTCSTVVPSGIVNLSGHWAECTGKQTMDNVHKIDAMPLRVKDKMDLIKKQFNIEQ